MYKKIIFDIEVGGYIDCNNEFYLNSLFVLDTPTWLSAIQKKISSSFLENFHSKQ